jgi:hypothetical protein
MAGFLSSDIPAKRNLKQGPSRRLPILRAANRYYADHPNSAIAAA